MPRVLYVAPEVLASPSRLLIPKDLRPPPNQISRNNCSTSIPSRARPRQAGERSHRVPPIRNEPRSNRRRRRHPHRPFPRRGRHESRSSARKGRLCGASGDVICNDSGRELRQNVQWDLLLGLGCVIAGKTPSDGIRVGVCSEVTWLSRGLKAHLALLVPGTCSRSRTAPVISTAQVMGPYSIPTPLGIRRGHCSDRGENSYMMRIGEAHLLTFQQDAGISNRRLLDLGPRLGVLDSVRAHALWWIMGLTSRGKKWPHVNRVTECRVSVAEHC